MTTRIDFIPTCKRCRRAWHVNGVGMTRELTRYVVQSCGFAPAEANRILQLIQTLGSHTMTIYLAGKVEKNCWRHKIVKNLRQVETKAGSWPVLEGAVFGHDYVGPYFISCDHGCYHGAEQHGLRTSFGTSCTDESYARADIVSSCLSAIDKADLVFAWIESTDTYGTLFELGYARAKGKRIVIATPDRKLLKELWFTLANATVIECDNPTDILSLIGDGRGLQTE